MKKIILTMIGLNYVLIFGQSTSSNNNYAAGKFIGYSENTPLTIKTNNINRAFFTTNSSLSSTPGNLGDGLRILDQAGGLGNLDLFTSQNAGGNETHIVFGQNGQISGQNSRLELFGNLNGFRFSTTSANGIYLFSRNNLETARIGTNNFWLIGPRPNANEVYGAQWDALRRLESCDDNIQLRLSYKSSYTTKYSDFRTRSTGNLNILPSGSAVNQGKILINLDAEPTATLDINGDERIRNVQSIAPDALIVGKRVAVGNAADLNIRRLDFPMNNTLFLNGSGQWSAIAGGGGSGNGFAACNDNVNGILSENSKINLNDKNIYFTQNPASVDITNNKVGLGYTCGDVLPAKLSVREGVVGSTVNVGTIAGYFINNDKFIADGYDAGTCKGIYVGSSGAHQGTVPGTLGPTNIGGHFEAGNALSFNTAVYAIAQGGQKSTGGYFSASSATESKGIFAKAQSTSGTNYGGMFEAITVGNGVNYGVYSTASGGSLNKAGYFLGILESSVPGNVTSDEQFKAEIQQQNNALEIINQLNPVIYQLKTNEYPQFNFSAELQHGFIAQEVEAVLPELIHKSFHPGETDSLGNQIYAPTDYKSMNYTGLISINTAAIKELNRKLEEKDQTITDLNNRLSRLESCLSSLLPSLCEMNQSAIEQNSSQMQQQMAKELKNVLEVKLSNKNTIVLSQNVPNPFAESTVIEYSIPESVQKAQIVFYNSDGKLINSVDITTRGKGELKVFANDLRSGTYTYSLVADNQVVVTKKMVKE